MLKQNNKWRTTKYQSFE